jgi:hypothetical protein
MTRNSKSSRESFVSFVFFANFVKFGATPQTQVIVRGTLHSGENPFRFDIARQLRDFPLVCT